RHRRVHCSIYFRLSLSHTVIGNLPPGCCPRTLCMYSSNAGDPVDRFWVSSTTGRPNPRYQQLNSWVASHSDDPGRSHTLFASPYLVLASTTNHCQAWNEHSTSCR